MSNAPHPAPARTRPRGPLLPTIGIIVGLVIVFFVLARFWTEWLWFGQLGFTEVLRTEWITRSLLFLVAGGIGGALIWLNLHLAYKNRPMYVPVTTQQNDLDRYREAFDPVRRLVFVAAPIVAGLFAGSAISGQWKTVLVALNGQPFGEKDPQFGIDLSFFLFTLPAVRMAITFLMTITFFCALVAVFTHYLYGGLQVSGNRGERISRAARIHVAVLAGVFTLLIAVNYWLDRYSLLAKQGDRFDGASFTDVNAVLPAKAILAVVGVLVAVLFFYTSARGSWKLPAIGVALMVASAVVVGGIYPAVIQSVRVDPNAQVLESEFIQRNIDATRDAYGLDDLDTQPYAASTETEKGQLREDAESTASIRLLDPTIVSATFRQLQQNKQYYQFPEELAVDRYDLNGETQGKTDTVIAVRELDLSSGSERSWVNDHTVFTHGFGVVAAYGNTVTDDGSPKFFEGGIPSKGDLPKYQPRIYFSPEAPEYSIVGAPEGTDPWELDYPDDDAPNGQVLSTYTGDGGPSVGNIWNQALFAARMGSPEILFSDRVTPESQILYERDPVARVAAVAPYLTLDGKVYPAVVAGDEGEIDQVVWVVDGYTTSNEYPYSARQQLSSAVTDSLTADGRPGMGVVEATQPNEVNYIRNSVKAVVNAFDGSVTLYAWDTEDPVLQTWNEIFPNSLEPISEISGSLMSHLRYPLDMFKVQRELLTRYHVTDASSFYSGGDFWRVPNDPVASGSQEVKQPPYYLSLRMPSQDSAKFSLTSSFILDTSDRNVLSGFLAVNAEPGSEPGKIDEDYGQLRLLELPRDQTVAGPGQVQNNFDSYAPAANELNILARGGSEVIHGNLLTLPVGGGLLYVQPVYVQASGGTQFPLMRKVLVSFGDAIGYASTLNEALDQVFGGDSGVTTPDAQPDGEGSGEGTGEGSGEGSGGDTGTLDAQARLTAALERARVAMEDSSSAMSAGDWAAYGTAQEALDQALQDAIAAEAELTGTTPPAGDEQPTDQPTDQPSEDSQG
ncbi:UPF0182 family protein [Pseudactinotalea sp. HY158]|uniref:UPF0182 family membrane protein n=1 Tax=Pseudactinotalea sp. HY158 TaxID=2654547 RepID=UPI001E43E9CA|nr:UPF0182 family protein [Pseudactinotalea sp. HY158]